MIPKDFIPKKFAKSISNSFTSHLKKDDGIHKPAEIDTRKFISRQDQMNFFDRFTSSKVLDMKILQSPAGNMEKEMVKVEAARLLPDLSQKYSRKSRWNPSTLLSKRFQTAPINAEAPYNLGTASISGKEPKLAESPILDCSFDRPHKDLFAKIFKL